MLNVQIDDLDGARGVADVQGEHVTRMSHYVGEHLAQVSAFRGVLGLFREQYAETVHLVTAGLRAEGARSVDLSAGFVTAACEFTEADSQAQRMLDQITESVRTSAESKLDAELDVLRGSTGPWGRAVDVHDALGDLHQTTEDLRESAAELRAEAAQWHATTEDLESYAAFVDGADQ